MTKKEIEIIKSRYNFYLKEALSYRGIEKEKEDIYWAKAIAIHCLMDTLNILDK